MKVLLTKANDDYWYSFATFKTFDDLVSYKEKAGCGLTILDNFWYNENPKEIFKSWSQDDDKFTIKDAYSISECKYEVCIENSEY